MTTYTHTTFLQAKDRLASLLGDSGKVFWTDTELGLYIKEALRVWGLASQYFRTSGRFSTVAGQAFYDISSITDSGGQVVQSLALTDRDLINDSLYQLIEPPITNWALGYQGSEMFTLTDLADDLEKARNYVRYESGTILTETSYNPVPAQNRLDLNESTSKLVRLSVAEAGSSGPLPMWPVDYFQAQSTIGSTYFPAVGRPKAYVTNYTPTLAVDLWPSPQAPSTIRVYSVQSLPGLTPTSSATVIGLPDDACWIARYQALGDGLGGDGLANAPDMAEYCRQRAEQGLDILKGYQSLLWATVGGRRMTISSLGQLDSQRPSWQQSTGSPKSLHQLGWNLFTVYPVPDAVYVIEVEIVTKAPIPTADGDFIQIGREQMDAIYRYSQHAASFKMQGSEFQATLPLLQETMEMAQEYQTQIAGSAINYPLQQRQAQSDRGMRPYRRRGMIETIQTEKEQR